MMALRLLWAVTGAALGAAWLWNRVRSPENLFATRRERVAPWLQAGVLCFSLLFAFVWLALALIRFGSPFELEWTGGAMRDHCWQLLQNQPLYARPSADWIAAPLPPLYWLLGALLMHLTGNASITILRLISFLSALGCVAVLIAWVRLLLPDLPVPLPLNVEADRAETHWTGKRWGRIAAGLFLTLYSVSGGWYDVERPEMLFVFLLLCAAYCLERALKTTTLRMAPISYFWIIGSGLLLTLAFLTRQQAVVFLLAGALALVWRRAWSQLLFFLLVCLILSGEAVWFLNQVSSGWFSYYAFHVPLSQPLIAPALQLQQPGFLLGSCLPLLALLLIAFTLGRHALRAEPPAELLAPEDKAREHISYAVLLGCALSALLGGLLFQVRFGEDGQLFTLGCILLACTACIVAGRWERIHDSVRAPIHALLLIQLLTWSYRPDLLLPTAENNAAGSRFAMVMRQLETQGEVLCLDHGGFTRPPHFHRTSLLAVLNAEKRLPLSLIAALRTQRYVAIVSDTLPDPKQPLDAELLRSYALGEGPDIGGPWVVLPPCTPQPHHRVWVLRPKK